jgi:hypothetical protein
MVRSLDEHQQHGANLFARIQHTGSAARDQAKHEVLPTLDASTIRAVRCDVPDIGMGLAIHSASKALLNTPLNQYGDSS